MEQRLYTLLLTSGTLKLSDVWLRVLPTKDQGSTDDFGATSLIIAAQSGHRKVVRFLSGARSQQAGCRLAWKECWRTFGAHWVYFLAVICCILGIIVIFDFYWNEMTWHEIKWNGVDEVKCANEWNDEMWMNGTELNWNEMMSILMNKQTFLIDWYFPLSKVHLMAVDCSMSLWDTLKLDLTMICERRVGKPWCIRWVSDEASIAHASARDVDRAVQAARTEKRPTMLFC